VAEQVRGVVLEAYLAHVVTLAGVAMPASARASERPRASPLARAQCAAELPVLSTLLPGNYVPETPLERRVLALLDGTRDRRALAGQLDETSEAIDAVLDQLAASALLIRD
jgi:hypothetical protein